jgi:hypothetical protein
MLVATRLYLYLHETNNIPRKEFTARRSRSQGRREASSAQPSYNIYLHIVKDRWERHNPQWSSPLPVVASSIATASAPVTGESEPFEDPMLHGPARKLESFHSDGRWLAVI